MALLPSNQYANESWDQRHFGVKIFHSVFKFVSELHRSGGTDKKLSDKMDEWLAEITKASFLLFDKVLVIDAGINPQQVYPKVASALAKYVRSTETGYPHAYLSLSEEDWLPLKRMVLGHWEATGVTATDKTAIRILLNQNIPQTGDFVDKHIAILKALFYQGTDCDLAHSETYHPKDGKKSAVIKKAAKKAGKKSVDYSKDQLGLIELVFQLMALAATPIDLAEEDVNQDKLNKAIWEEGFKKTLGEIYDSHDECRKTAASKGDFIESNFQLTTLNIKGYENLSQPVQDALSKFKETYPRPLTKEAKVTADLDTKFSYLSTGLNWTLTKVITERSKHAKTKTLSDEQAKILNYWGQFSTQYRLYDKTQKIKQAYQKIDQYKTQVKQLISTVIGGFEKAQLHLTEIKTSLTSAYDELIKLQDNQTDRIRAEEDKALALKELETARLTIQAQDKRAREAKDDKALIAWYEDIRVRLKETLYQWCGKDHPDLRGADEMDLGQLIEHYKKLSYQEYQTLEKTKAVLEEKLHVILDEKERLSSQLIALSESESGSQQREGALKVYYAGFNQGLVKQIGEWQRIKGVTYPALPDDLDQKNTHDLFKIYWSMWQADYAHLEEKTTALGIAKQRSEEANLLLSQKLLELEKQHARQIDGLTTELNGFKQEVKSKETTIEELCASLKAMGSLQQDKDSLSSALESLRSEHQALLLTMETQKEGLRAAEEKGSLLSAELSRLRIEVESVRQQLQEREEQLTTDVLVVAEKKASAPDTRPEERLYRHQGTMTEKREDDIEDTRELIIQQQEEALSSLRAALEISKSRQPTEGAIDTNTGPLETIQRQEEELNVLREELAALKLSAIQATPVTVVDASVDFDMFVDTFSSAFDGTNSKGIQAMINKMNLLVHDRVLNVSEKKAALKAFMHETALRLEDRWQSRVSIFSIMKGRTKGVNELYHLMARDSFKEMAPDKALRLIEDKIASPSSPLVHGH